MYEESVRPTTHVIIDGHRIATGCRGAGEPLVLVHGTPAHSIIWRKVIPALVAKGFKVHWFDLLGFGASECPLNSDTSVAAQAKLLERLFDHWQLETTHLFGHDIGGAASLRLAFEHSDRLRSLTIADICSYDSWPSPTWKDVRDNYRTYAVMDAESHRELMIRQLGKAVFHSEVMRGEVLEAYLAPIVGVIGQPAFYRHQVAHYDAVYTRDFTQRLPLLDLPVQILWGAEDAWQPVEYAHRLAGDIPGATLHIIEEAGHFLMEDAPDEVVAHVAAFALQHRADT
jgi:pimeloyl-ACP methyl ester carboxylesterase